MACVSRCTLDIVHIVDEVTDAMAIEAPEVNLGVEEETMAVEKELLPIVEAASID